MQAEKDVQKIKWKSKKCESIRPYTEYTEYTLNHFELCANNNGPQSQVS